MKEREAYILMDRIGPPVHTSDFKYLLLQVLEKIKNSKEREAYILMDRIRPPVQQNYLVRPHNEPTLAEVVSELGIFGVIIG